jgi:oligosaccharide reducing-end xylanase
MPYAFFISIIEKMQPDHRNGGNYMYRNVFAEAGMDQADIDRRVEDTFNGIFYGEDAFVSFSEDKSIGYIYDTGNNDVRTEGVSYAMMMCVQMDRQTEFNAIWNFAKTYMYMTEGPYSGYFAWSVKLTGEKNAYGPAPDGEEYMAMALLFASARWGDGEGIYNYGTEARSLLHDLIHKGEQPGEGRAMWDRDNHLIRFIPDRDYTDPSYHLPHFYTLFSKYGPEEDREFWAEAARASRQYLMKAVNPDTGMSAEYSYFDGTPYEKEQEIFGRHDWYYSDAYRTIANIALDYEWSRHMENAPDSQYTDFCKKASANLQSFFAKLPDDQKRGIYLTNGTVLEGEKALHPVAITATNAAASLISAPLSEDALSCVREFWNTPLRTGDRRYYDNCLYMFAMLSLSGKYSMYTPEHF